MKRRNAMSGVTERVLTSHTRGESEIRFNWTQFTMGYGFVLYVFAVLHLATVLFGNEVGHGNGIWGEFLEDWTTANHRQKRVLTFTPTYQTGFVGIERLDVIPEPSEVQESKIALPSKISSPSKIVNKPPPTHKQKPAPSPQQQPVRHITETDLYLLGAMEKLVFRLDFMEKRLRKVEEMLYYVTAGNRIDQEPCPGNFTRAGHGCYLFASNAGRELDWKAASKQCLRQGAVLAELETIEENQDVVAHIQTSSHLKGKDFWTGGLNPGLLWIWSNSARPVATDKNKAPQTNIVGDGRCLRLSYDPALRSYSYKGSDCSVRYSYICESPDKTSSNEIDRIGRERKVFTDEL